MTEECLAKIRILIAEDHPLTRLGIKAILERRTNLSVVGEAGNGVVAVQLASVLLPDLIVMNVRMPVLNGIDAARQIHQQHPTIKIIMLTSLADEHDLFASFAAGATGYCLKDIDMDHLYAAIYAINDGDAWIDSRSAGAVLRHWQQEKTDAAAVSFFLSDNKVDCETVLHTANGLSPESRCASPIPLSPRERQVLALVADGLNNQQIADRLVISLATAKTHVRNILNKLAVNDRTQAAVEGLRQGIVS